MTATVGTEIPGNLILLEDNSANKVTTESVFAGKKVILFGLPGAFTPGCSKTHLPGYVADYEKFKAKGVDEIVCVTINDPYVTAAWADASNARGKIRILADVHGQLTNALGLQLDLSEYWGLAGQRMKRFSAYVVDGVIRVLNIEHDDDNDLTCSLSNELLSQI
eukprot:gene8646-9527_t